MWLQQEGPGGCRDCERDGGRAVVTGSQGHTEAPPRTPGPASLLPQPASCTALSHVKRELTLSCSSGFVSLALSGDRGCRPGRQT